MRGAGPGTDPPGDEQLPGARQLLDEVVAFLADLRGGSPPSVALGSDLQRDLGLDSLAVVELQDRLERSFGVRLTAEALATGVTLEDWRRALVAAGSAPGTPAAPATPATPATPVSPRAAGPLRGTPVEERPTKARSLPEVLAWHVAAHPDLVAVRLLGGAGKVGEDVEDLSYGQLSAEATEVARTLLGGGLEKGQRVALMLPTGRDLFVVLVGILLAGGVPVPLYPPARTAVLEEHLRRQARLLENSGAILLVTVPEAKAAAWLVAGHVPTLGKVEVPAALRQVRGGGPGDGGGDGGVAGLPEVRGEDVALIQYTSGSTGEPKGVVLTNSQLLANIRAMGEAAEVSSGDVFVSWLPLYHDMGLIGAFLAPLYFGFPLVVTSPLTFLARPASWLEAITTYGGTLTAAPNFAYQACADRVTDAELAGLDLSSLRVAFNGSEPVAATTLDAFADRFAVCGFRRETMCPAYGLAEVGVGVAFTALGRGPRIDRIDRDALAREGRAVPLAGGDRRARAVVACGRPLPGYEVRIGDPGGEEVPDRWEGAVTCRGPSATAGYFDNPVATRALWRRGWLETGDLGYVADGELFLTGRAKDLVIRGGRNLHPEDLEEAIETLEGIERHGAVVFASLDEHLGTERLVAVVETKLTAPEERAQLESMVRAACSDVAGVPPDVVALVVGGSLPRTASGKLRRGAARQAFESGDLGRLPPPVRVQLVRLAASALQPVAHRLAREAEAWGFALIAWVAAVVLVVPVWLLVQLPSPLAIRWRLVRSAGQALRALTGIEVSIEGNAPPASWPAVVVANHESFLDGLLVVLAFPDPVVLVASTELAQVPLVGRFLARLGCVFVERGDAAKGRASIETLARVVRNGGRLVVFPEGSITRVPGLRPFHLGAFAAAAAGSCSVVPAGISGSRGVLRPGAYLPRPGRVRFAFGRPIRPTGSDFAAQVALRDAARKAIGELSGEPDLVGTGQA